MKPPAFSIDTAPTRQVTGSLRGVERRFDELSREVSEFAGYWIGEEGDLVIAVTDARSGDAVKDLVRSDAAAFDREGQARRITTVEAQYSFATLRQWRDKLRPYVRARDDVRYLDLDEKANKIVLGIMRGAHHSDLEGMTQALGLPADVVMLGEGDPFTPDGGRYASSLSTASLVDSTLSFKFDSVPAGVQIKFTFTGSSPCTQGFAARRVSVGDTIFVTSSHCTEDFALTDDTELFQGTTSAGDKIGEELVDPTQTCGSKCRDSDLAVFEWTNTSRRTFSRIARTLNSNGSRVIYDSIPRFSVDVELSSPTVGLDVEMMGQASGWRAGEVVRTCVDIENWPSSTEDYTLECQDMADYTRQGGDSGGPVFVWQSGLFKLLGIHTGARSDTAFFGAMDGIETDIGSVVVVGPFVM